MRVLYQRRFLKQLAKLPSHVRLDIERFVFEDLPKAENIASIGKIEKLQGYTGFYKIRFGSYRVGLRVANDFSIQVEIVMHRGEIYQNFP